MIIISCDLCPHLSDVWGSLLSICYLNSHNSDSRFLIKRSIRSNTVPQSTVVEALEKTVSTKIVVASATQHFRSHVMANHMQRWTLGLDKILWESRDCEVQKLAEYFGRTNGSITSRLQSLREPTNAAHQQLSQYYGKPIGARYTSIYLSVYNQSDLIWVRAVSIWLLFEGNWSAQRVTSNAPQLCCISSLTTTYVYGTTEIVQFRNLHHTTAELREASDVDWSY